MKVADDKFPVKESKISGRIDRDKGYNEFRGNVFKSTKEKWNFSERRETITMITKNKRCQQNGKKSGGKK